MNLRFNSVIKVSGGVIGAALLTIGLYLGYLQLTPNFATVVPGQLYRSAQLDGPELRAYAKQYSIRSVINLRGENTGRPWYDTEAAVSKNLGISHYDFRMSAGRELTQKKAEALISMMKEAPKPLLVHCMSGADRSGLASALYVAAVEHGGEEAAESQISLYFGHLSLPFISAYAMDRTFENLEPWLGFHDS
jgi:protein tyrosine/serine phosphatase